MRKLLFLFLVSFPVFAAFPNGYSYCKVVTTLVSMVSGTSDLPNYPLTVILTDADLKTTVNGGLVNDTNGYDIGFYPDCSGSGTALKWEMESYSATTGAIVAHVLRPALSHITNDTIGMYYGGSFSTFQSTASAVWDANYKGVWHLSNGTSYDSTSNGINGTPHYSPTLVTGKIGDAAGFDGVHYYGKNISFPTTGLPLGANTRTLETWFKLATTAGGYAGDGAMLAYGDNASMARVSLYYVYNSGSPQLLLETGGAGQAVYAWSAADTNWHHFVATYPTGQTSSNQWLLYLDGSPLSLSYPSPSTMNTTVADTSVWPAMGTLSVSNGTAVDSFYGSLDEPRISNIARSANWILTEYRNQSAPGTYISLGSRIVPSNPKLIITNWQ
jgi:hypothetical protein